MNIPQDDYDALNVVQEFDVVSYLVFFALNGRCHIPLSPQFATKAQASEFLAEVSKYIPGAYIMRWHAYFPSADDTRRQQALTEILFPSDGYVLANRIEQALMIKEHAETLFGQSENRDLGRIPRSRH